MKYFLGFTLVALLVVGLQVVSADDTSQYNSMSRDQLLALQVKQRLVIDKAQVQLDKANASGDQDKMTTANEQLDAAKETSQNIAEALLQRAPVTAPNANQPSDKSIENSEQPSSGNPQTESPSSI